jgi:hypothetical protein
VLSGSSKIGSSEAAVMGSVLGSVCEVPVYVDGPMKRYGNSSSRGSRACPLVPSRLRFVVAELAREGM